MTTWFCDAYASWQKGGIENANGRLRRWLPRQIDIDKVSDQEIQDIVITDANLRAQKMPWLQNFLFRQSSKTLAKTCKSGSRKALLHSLSNPGRHGFLPSPVCPFQPRPAFRQGIRRDIFVTSSRVFGVYLIVAYVGGDPSGLVAGEQLGRRPSSRLLLEIDIGERLPTSIASVADRGSASFRTCLHPSGRQSLARFCPCARRRLGRRF